jgi:cytochrome c peroxidase
MPENERYSRKGASFAISAYLRQNLTNQAPFQKWLKGEKDGNDRAAEERSSTLFWQSRL